MKEGIILNFEKFQKIREEQFPLATRCAYMDTATTGVFSKRSRNAMIDFIENRYYEGMDIQEFNENWIFADKFRDTVAEMINADSDEIFFSDSGSAMLSIFSSGIEIKENANVVTSGLSFPSTPYNWMNRVGVENVRIAQPENGQMPCEKLFELVDENTVAIALCLVENTTGFYHDIKTISEFCQKKGIYLVIDATQCIGAMKIDLKETPVDFLVATSYKWISGLFGVAIGYVSKKTLNKIKPTFVGWTGNKDRHNHSRYKLDLSDGANKFELGSLNWVGLKGIEQSIKLYLELGKDDVRDYILSLTDYLYERVGELKNVSLVGPFPKENRSGITYITFPKEWKLTDSVMKENGLRVHVASDTTVRIALHYYNNKADIDKLINYLKTYEN